MDTGFFLLVVILSFIFTFGAFRAVGNIKGILHIVAMALFLVTSVYVGAGYEVASTSTEQRAIDVNGTFTVYTANNTDVFITGNQDSYWLMYVFVGLSFLNLALFVKDVWSGT